jgi:hypothetical protein
VTQSPAADSILFGDHSLAAPALPEIALTPWLPTLYEALEIELQDGATLENWTSFNSSAVFCRDLYHLYEIAFWTIAGAHDIESDAPLPTIADGNPSLVSGENASGKMVLLVPPRISLAQLRSPRGLGIAVAPVEFHGEQGRIGPLQEHGWWSALEAFGSELGWELRSSPPPDDD